MGFLNDPRLNFLPSVDRSFVFQFDNEMRELGYDHGDEIGSGYCWGKYMLIFRRTGVKSRQVYARVYLRESGAVLRLFLNNIDRHRAFLENAPAHIQEPFTGAHGDCQHCHNEKDGRCRFRKTYTLFDRQIEKCNGVVFEFQNPCVEKLGDYVDLFTEFYPVRKSKN